MAAIVPFSVGALLPGHPFSEIDFRVLFSGLIATVFLTIGVNLINDALDFKKGADTKQRIGPLRVTQAGLLSPQAVLASGLGALLLAFLFAIPLMYKGGVVFLYLTLASMVSAYLYTGGPYPLSYKGLGELFVILFYGFAAVLSSYYLQTGYLNLDAVIGSLQIGFLATVMLAINNLRDIDEDRKSGKRTLAAQFGEDFGRKEITALALLPYFLNFYWLLQGRLLTFLLPYASLFIAVNLIRCIYKHPPGKIYNRYLGEASLLMTLFGILLVLG